MNEDTWDSLWESYKNKSNWDDQTRLIFEIISKIKVFKNNQILEAGSGSGRISWKLAESNNLILVDYSINAIKLSKALFSRGNKTGYFICASIFNLPFKEKVFDLG